jgi:hypothetical protein
MLVNELICLPTRETLDYLSHIFSGCPFDLDLSKCYVVLNISEEQMETEPDNVYKATAGNMNVWYDTGTEMSSLILPLISPELNARAQELRADAPSAFYGSHYFPHMVVVQDMPPMARHFSSFISSMAHVLATTPDSPLFFDAELVMSKNYYAVPQADFYASMLANHYRN